MSPTRLLRAWEERDGRGARDAPRALARTVVLRWRSTVYADAATEQAALVRLVAMAIDVAMDAAREEERR